jgi:hypothetical protein
MERSESSRQRRIGFSHHLIKDSSRRFDLVDKVDALACEHHGGLGIAVRCGLRISGTFAFISDQRVLASVPRL